MKIRSRWTVGFVCAVSLAVVAGCSKSVAPERDAAEAQREAGETSARSPRAFVARLVFSGTTVELGPRWRPRERHAIWYVYSMADVGSRVDTIPVNARVLRAEWGSARYGAPFTPEPPVNIRPGLNSASLASPLPGGGAAEFRFHAGFRPSVWWAGPDPRAWPMSSDGDGRSVTIGDWSRFTESPGWPADLRRWFGPDSFAYVFSERLPVARDLDRRTFHEILGDRVWARSEGDTVHLGATIVLGNGGFDRDSEYRPRVVAGDPGLPAGWLGDLDRYAMLNAQGRIGSPIGFRHRYEVHPPGGGVLQSAMTTPYPFFDASSVYRSPHTFGYLPVTLPGWWYVQVRAEDAEGMLSPAAPSLGDLVELVDGGGGSPAERLLRRSILKFYVKPPTR